MMESANPTQGSNCLHEGLTGNDACMCAIQDHCYLISKSLTFYFHAPKAIPEMNSNPVARINVGNVCFCKPWIYISFSMLCRDNAALTAGVQDFHCARPCQRSSNNAAQADKHLINLAAL